MDIVENVKTYEWVEEPRENLYMHPQKFALWLFIVSIVMFFAALTSAYIVRKGEGNWLEFELPMSFWANSIVILISSLTMHWAYLLAKKNEVKMLKVAMGITGFLGSIFLIGQFIAWGSLVNSGVFFTGPTSNPSGSFLYVLTGMHWLHLISGVVFLMIVVFDVFRFKVHSKRILRIEMCATYWHFLDILWLYLFAFLLLNHYN